MITAAEYNCLDYHKQTEAVLKGTFLAERLTEHYYIKLYYLYSFYVEVFFDDHSHLITHFDAFYDSKLIMPYLDDLKIAV